MSKLDQVVYGMMKNARKEARREIVTRFGLARGGRQVDDASAEMLPIPARPGVSADARVHRLWLLRIVLRQLREFTTIPRYRRLLTRRLFRGEAITSLAQELMIHPPTARSIVRRARVFLGLKG